MMNHFRKIKKYLLGKLFPLSFIGVMLFTIAGSFTITATPAIAQPAQGAVYYVSTSGTDSNLGTLSQPWKTIQKAVNSVNAGDTVYIRAGTYNETVQINGLSGTATAPILFTNYQGETVIVKATDWTGIYIYNQSNWITIDGLKVTGAVDHGISISNASNILIQNCEVYGNSWAGIFIAGAIDQNKIGGNTQNNRVTNCSIHNNTHEGIYMKSGWATEIVSGLMVDKNNIYNNGDEAVQNTYWEQSPNNPAPPTGTIIRGNNIYGNGGDWGLMDLMGDNLLVEDNNIHDNIGKTTNAGATNDIGITFQHGSGLVVRNNIISNSSTLWPSSAIFYLDQPGSVHIYNNTIYNTNHRGVRISSPSAQVLIENNVFIQVTENLIVGADANTVIDHNFFDKNDGTTGTNALIGDPKFINAAGANFHLQNSSLAIDAGINLTTQNPMDYDNNPRPQGKGMDIGAYEFITTTTNPTATPTNNPSQPTPTSTLVPTITRTPSITTTPKPGSPNVFKVFIPGISKR